MTANVHKRPLTERRQARTERSRQAQQEYWAAKFDRAETPLELLEVAYLLLRSRCGQLERDAAKAGQRAKTAPEVDAARQRIASARDQITQVCGDAAAELERLANTIDTTRR